MLLEIRDYLMITLGIFIYCMGWAAFLLPYEIATGGVTGIAAIIFYATGFPVQNSYLIVNVMMIVLSFKLLGKKFIIKTAFAIISMTFILWLCQEIVASNIEGKILGSGGQDMACVIGAAMCGIGMGIVFINNGSTGGTDIIAAVVNKYKDIGMGRMIIYSDIIIISSCYFVFHSWSRVVYGFVTLVIIGYVIDLLVNGSRSSVQFLIISKKYKEIADAINKGPRRGVTFINAQGYYSKEETQIVMVLARKRQSIQIFRTIKMIDPKAFISQSQVIGVYGEGFDIIKG
ncbi:MAG: YitT family protein [Bacteroidaceae bacterium]